MSIPDDELMRMYADGDEAAFDLLADRWAGPVFNLARRLLDDAAAAEEVMQDTLLAAGRAADRYAGEGRFRAWLLRIARNLCLNRLKAERARREISADGVLRLTPLPVAGNAPWEQLVADETERRVQAALGRLPEREREAVVLHAVEGLSYREVAEVLGAPLGTVKTLIHRARAHLAGLLAENERSTS